MWTPGRDDSHGTHGPSLFTASYTQRQAAQDLVTDRGGKKYNVQRSPGSATVCRGFPPRLGVSAGRTREWSGNEGIDTPLYYWLCATPLRSEILKKGGGKQVKRGGSEPRHCRWGGGRKAHKGRPRVALWYICPTRCHAGNRVAVKKNTAMGKRLRNDQSDERRLGKPEDRVSLGRPEEWSSHERMGWEGG